MNTDPAVMSESRFSYLAAAELDRMLELPKIDVDPNTGLLDAGLFAFRFGSFGQLYAGVDDELLATLQSTAHDVTRNQEAGITRLAHWSIARGEAGDVPGSYHQGPGVYDDHQDECGTCNFLEGVLGQLDLLINEAPCAECGGRAGVHDITIGEDGRPALVCLPPVFERDLPEVERGEDVGGDHQVGASYSARWVVKLTNDTYGMVTRTFYLGEDDDRRRYVCCVNEYLVCADDTKPGDTEIDFEESRQDVPVEDPTTTNLPALAEQAAAPDEEEWVAYAPERARELLPERQPA